MTKPYPDVPRIMAIVISTGRMGYVVLEGDNFLVDWGSHVLRSLSDQERLEKACKTLAWYLPDVVILENVTAAGCQKGTKTKQLVKKLAQETRRRKIEVSIVNRQEVRQFFAAEGGTNKDLMARLVCNHLPELIRILPNPRKPWNSEQHGMPIFEAAGFALVHLRKHAR